MTVASTLMWYTKAFLLRHIELLKRNQNLWSALVIMNANNWQKNIESDLLLKLYISLINQALKILVKANMTICLTIFWSSRRRSEDSEDLRPASLLKKRFRHRCFLVNFTKFLTIPFFIKHLWWLLLDIWSLITDNSKALYM